MDEGFKQQASEWFERGDREIETAQLLYDEEGYADAIAYHIEQAVEKYLKGYLVLKGQKSPWGHEVDSLLNLVGKFEADLYPQFIELCEKAQDSILRTAIRRGHRQSTVAKKSKQI